MIYKKHTVEKVYFTGSDTKELKDGRLVDRKPTNRDIEYYALSDPEGVHIINEFTIPECKELVDKREAIDERFK